MHMNKKRIRKQFDRHANEYDQHAHIQRDLADKLIQMLENTKRTYKQILEIGCGTGYLTERLLELYPKAELVLVDLSEAMMMKTKQRLSGSSASIQYITEDAEKLVSSQSQTPSHQNYAAKLTNESFDLIVSNATFQWFNHPQETIQGYFNYLLPQGVFAFSTFGQRTFHELHSSFERASLKLNLPLVRHGQDFYPMKFWSDFLTKAAVELEIFDEDRIELFACVRDFLHSVKKVGASNATNTAGRGSARSRALIECMEECYTDTYGTQLGIQATYQLSGGIYKKN